MLVGSNACASILHMSHTGSSFIIISQCDIAPVAPLVQTLELPDTWDDTHEASACSFVGKKLLMMRACLAVVMLRAERERERGRS
jgi:hypothetical protein